MKTRYEVKDFIDREAGIIRLSEPSFSSPETVCYALHQGPFDFFLHLTKQQAIDMAAALVDFAKRIEVAP